MATGSTNSCGRPGEITAPEHERLMMLFATRQRSPVQHVPRVWSTSYVSPWPRIDQGRPTTKSRMCRLRIPLRYGGSQDKRNRRQGCVASLRYQATFHTPGQSLLLRWKLREGRAASGSYEPSFGSVK
jgi:hypothetical protein